MSHVPPNVYTNVYHIHNNTESEDAHVRVIRIFNANSRYGSVNERGQFTDLRHEQLFRYRDRCRSLSGFPQRSGREPQ